MRLVVVLSNHQYIFFCSYQVEHFIEEVFNVFTFILCHFESISAYIILNEELHQRDLSWSESHRQFCLLLLFRCQCVKLFNYESIQFSNICVITCDEFEFS